MTIPERITAFLLQNQNEYCDDCIAEFLELPRRQEVNGFCNKQDSGISSKQKGKCYNCGKIKKTRFIVNLNNPPADYVKAIYKANTYANSAVIHSSLMRKADSYLKEVFTSEFEAALFIKLKEFTAYISSKSGLKEFDSFAANSFINNDENYKKAIWDEANAKLKKLKTITDFGEGNLLRGLIECIEIPGNNLLKWNSKQGPESRVHDKLYQILETKESLKDIEELIWDFFFADEQPEYFFFDAFTEIVNKKYSLISYLYFIKDKSKYLPIATTTVDDFFSETGLALRTTMKCSWENYYSYISIMEYLRNFLRENLDPDATLIDAQTFIWILEKQYKADISNHKYEVPETLELKEKDRETIVKARTGQGLYRKRLLEKWNNTSSISDYSNSSFLVASHIKPWKVCDNKECIDPENGLLLIPTYDFLFDKGYISFNDNGSVIISSHISDLDLKEFAFDFGCRIKVVSEKMKEYLAYHRENILRK